MEPNDDKANVILNFPRLLTWEHIADAVPYTRQHIQRLEKRGEFPRRVTLGGGRVAWREDELKAWVERKSAERKPATKPTPKPRGRPRSGGQP